MNLVCFNCSHLNYVTQLKNYNQTLIICLLNCFHIQDILITSAMLFCETEFCVYKGIPYSHGQTWNDGCDKTCRCEDVVTGQVNCDERCVAHRGKRKDKITTEHRDIMANNQNGGKFSLCKRERTYLSRTTIFRCFCDILSDQVCQLPASSSQLSAGH